MLMTRKMAVEAVKQASMNVARSKLIERKSALSAMRALHFTTKYWLLEEAQDGDFSLFDALISIERANFVATFIYRNTQLSDALAEIMYRLRYEVPWDEEVSRHGVKPLQQKVIQLLEVKQ